MSSHWKWVEKVVREHDINKPFAPENGNELKFKVGDVVTFTNDYGVAFEKHKVIGLYQPTEACSLYARGARYHLDTSCHWFPKCETSLSLQEVSSSLLQ